jgi:hypothetical protein
MRRPQITADAVTTLSGFDAARTPPGFKLTLSSDKFARAVYLSMPNYPGFFSDNYFDLIPGQKVEVEFRAGAAIALSDFRKQLKIRTMADAFEVVPSQPAGASPPSQPESCADCPN